MVAFNIVANGTEQSTKDIVYNPLEIRTWQDLQAMRQNLAEAYTLASNIVFPYKGVDGFDGDYNFEPIGKDTDNPTRIYDGSPFQTVLMATVIPLSTCISTGLMNIL